MKKKTLSIAGIIAVIAIMAAAYFLFYGMGFQQTSYTGANLPSNVKIAVPHFGSYMCDVLQDKTGLTYPLSGQKTISQSSVGFYTNQITNLRVDIDYGFWTSLISDKRVRYHLCTLNGACGSDTIETYTFPGQKKLEITSVDLTKYYFIIYYEKQTITGALLGRWEPDTQGATISYDSKAFGLRLYSTTRDPAGTPICSSSCDLSCPQQGYQEKLVYTTKNVVGFYETVPYLEYWESLDYDLNSQGGATVYNTATNTFCLAGAIYSAKTLSMDSGLTYIYPDTATRQVKACCPGAVISTSTEDKICQPDYTWKTISKTDRISCISDVNCPGQGLNTCQNRVLSGWHCSGYDSAGRFCQKDTSSTTVQCCGPSDCLADQVCQYYKCVGGSVVPPIPPVPPNNSNKDDCTTSTSWGIHGQWVEKSTSQCGFWCSIGLAQKTVTTSAICEYPGRDLLIIGIFVVAGLVILIIYFTSKKKGAKK